MIYLILAFGFIARLVVLNQSLWLDEAIGAIVVKTFTFRDILLKFPLSDNHPPLYYLILKAWTLLFGYSGISLRMPSIIFGIGAIYFVYQIAKKFTKVNPLIPAVLLATSPLAIYYSQEARMYSLAAFLATAGIFYFLETLRDSKNLKYWLGFVIFYTLLPFSDYVPIFLYPVFIIFPLISRAGWKWWKRFILGSIPLAVMGVAWLPIFIKQGTAGRWLLNILPAWRDIAGGATFKQLGVFWSKFVLGRISFYDKTLYYSLIFLASVPVIWLLVLSLRKWKDRKIYWLWFLTPVVLGFAASIVFPAFIYFRFIFVLPAFYLLLALGANDSKILGKWLIGLVIAFNLAGWLIYVFDPVQHREDWRGAVAYVEANAAPNEIAVFENPEPFAPYRWYWRGIVKSVGITDSISADTGKTEKIVGDLVKGESGVYYFEYLKDLEDPQGIVQTTLTQMGYIEVGRRAFNGVGFVIHYRLK
jgi:4-amino-4-deoxy-L-arabinose transferase-like glycosyltransferase